ncbi:hypothetical protein [Thioalbus denitrificans]|uniref:Uncharacterized protein n=1 Tax=Thioalbus denitrificans TaxID=547122 RepID=A0A369CB32_9GAMM|nr:hypothetical protein [Thioalbus denitrificans]RCX31232.1 hypothetical protein DFQ59_103198 [Thioalbus denitrificans]
MLWWPKAIYESLPASYLVAGLTSLYELPKPLALWPGCTFLCAGALAIFMRVQYRNRRRLSLSSDELRHVHRQQRMVDRRAEAALKEFEFSQSHGAQRRLTRHDIPDKR